MTANKCNANKISTKIITGRGRLGLSWSRIMMNVFIIYSGICVVCGIGMCCTNRISSNKWHNQQQQ
jgi:hypothetical protein